MRYIKTSRLVLLMDQLNVLNVLGASRKLNSQSLMVILILFLENEILMKQRKNKINQCYDDDMYEAVDDYIDGSHGGLIGPEMMRSINDEDDNR